MRLERIIVFAAFALAGCSGASRVPPGVVESTIDGELRRAAQGRAAAQPAAVSEALLPPLTVQMPGPTKPVEARFDLAVNNAPANQIFMALAAGTRYSMLVHPDVKEPISINLKDVTLLEALDAIREIYGYEYKVQGTRIYIEPVTLQTRIFQVDYLAARRAGRADVRVSSGSMQITAQAPPATATGQQPNGQPGAPQAAQGAPSTGSASTTPTPLQRGYPQALESSRVTMSSDMDFWNDLQTAIRSIVGFEGGRSVVVNTSAGVLMVRAMPKELRTVDQYLKTLSTVVHRQVMLEAKIIEVTLTDQFSTGVNWAAFGERNARRAVGGILGPGTTLRSDGTLGSSSFAADPAGSGVSNTSGGLGSAVTAAVAATGGAAAIPAALFGLAFQTSNFAALIQFLESQGTVHVLSSPRISALNNQKAVIKVGTDELFITSISTTTVTSGPGLTTVTPTIETTPLFSGISLDVTPQISDDDQITLHIHPSVTSVTDRTRTVSLGGLGAFTLALASSAINESDTIVRLQDGTIAAIGGLMRQSQTNTRSGLPGTTDSAAGALAGNRDSTLTKSELVILLKPTIIRGDAAWQQQAQDLNERMQNMRRPVPEERR